MPFNRATRGCVYRLAKNEGGVIGFGSTYDLHRPGALIFVNHPFPVLEEARLPTPSFMLGEGYCREPFEARSIVNISGMSFGAISAPADEHEPGDRHDRAFRREHVRIVQASGQSVALNMLYPYPEPKAKMKVA